MLVIRKELKVGVAVAAGILGVAAVYGLMALLGNRGGNAGSDLAQNSNTEQVAPDGVINVPDVAPNLDNAQVGLPPKEGTTPESKPAVAPVDPFAESFRTDGSSNDDKWTAAWNTGRVSNASQAVVNNARSGSATANGSAVGLTLGSSTPIITRLPDTQQITGDTTLRNELPTGGTYVIQPGDTFSKIAGKVYGDRNLYHVIEKANPQVNPTRLKINATITVPSVDTVRSERSAVVVSEPEIVGTMDATRQYRVQSGDTLHRIAQRLYGRSVMWESIYDANKQKIGPDAGKLRIGTVLTLPQSPTTAL
ncbi:MAG: LysM peptidoglycan-binding domain-containing protein [Burkholderiales bacterium]|nr:LysM peptidoglycan-binding domain-containing protein [Phycisphaerae bacterium]